MPAPGVKQMNVIGYDERVQLKPSSATITVQCFQEKADMGFHNEEPLTLPRRERDEISSRWGDQASWFHGRTSAAGSRSTPSLNWHEWNSCPSQFFFSILSVFGKTRTRLESRAKTPAPHRLEQTPCGSRQIEQEHFGVFGGFDDKLLRIGSGAVALLQ